MSVYVNSSIVWGLLQGSSGVFSNESYLRRNQHKTHNIENSVVTVVLKGKG